MIKTIYKVATYLFFALLAMIGVLVVISAFPIDGNYQIKVVKSGSMEPTIRTGSIVVVKPAEVYAIGDIITFEGGFRDPEGNPVPVTHRIIGERKEGSRSFYKMKGDANDDPDLNEVTKGNVLGKVYFSLPFLGYMIEAARQPYGLLALIILPAAIIIYEQSVSIFREVKRLKKIKNEARHED